MGTAAAIATIVYGALLELGGVMGYRKARSRPSLIMGTAFGTAVVILGVAGLLGARFAPAAAALAAFLLVFFSIRWLRGRKFMPAGLIAVLSLLALGVDLAAALLPG